MRVLAIFDAHIVSWLQRTQGFQRIRGPHGLNPFLAGKPDTMGM